MKNVEDLGLVIKQFGRQWTRYSENLGFYGSVESLKRLLETLLDPAEIEGNYIADVGAGSGRYTRMFHELGARAILAVEPSDAFDILKRNTADLDKINYLRATADLVPNYAFDFIFCIGVLQFIAQPVPALKSMGNALGSGGQLFLWVYGKENNRLYLRILHGLRLLTRTMPHGFVDWVSRALAIPAGLYTRMSFYLPLPLSTYMREYFSKMDCYSRRLIIYDQLNPRFVKYYTRYELQGLLEECGFTDIRMHHHLGYSWSVLARYMG